MLKLSFCIFVLFCAINTGILYYNLNIVNAIISFIGLVLFFATIAVFGIFRYIVIIPFTALGILGFYTFDYHISYFDFESFFVIFHAIGSLKNVFANYVNYTCAYYFVLALLSSIGGLYYAKKVRFNQYLSVVVFVIYIFALWPKVATHLPFAFFVKMKYIIENELRLEKALKNQINIAEKYHFKDKSNKKIMVFLIRTEAIRQKDFKANVIENLLKQKNVVLYPNVYSMRNRTEDSMPFILSRFKEENTVSALSESSFIGIFKKVGFQTNYISHDDDLYIDNIKKFVHESENIWNANTLDKIGYKQLKYDQSRPDNNLYLQFLSIKQNHKLKEKSLNIISHGIGAHIPFVNFDTKEAKFLPYCRYPNSINICTNQELLNSYKNCVSYIDQITNNFINEVKNENTIIIFTSDHGSSVGENGKYGHGFAVHPFEASEEQRNVATFVWFSDTFAKNNPDKVKAIKLNNNNKLNHGFVFHSMLDCAGIESEIIDKKLSICHTV